MKILIIEDDEDVRVSLIQALLEEGFVVDSAEDGLEGLYRAIDWRYDIIILDIMLPKLDGWEILERLRRERVRTPVLMLTALNDFDNRVKGLDQGADDYLTKPYNHRELVARIRVLHRRSIGQSDHLIELCSVLIDTLSCEVSIRGELINLTAAQYRILTYLAERRGQVVSRDELEESMVGESDSALSNVIDVQIHHIRRKLGKDLIENRRGLGYLIPEG